MTRYLSVLSLTLFVCFSVAWAESQDEDYNRLARISYIDGDVSFRNSSDTDWSAASINLPMVPGDRIYTGPNGRAEIEFDDGSTFRLAESTDIEFLSLDEDLIQLRILAGLSTLSVDGNIDFEINTPAAAFNTVSRGVYRFDVIENGDTDAVVREGELEVANDSILKRVRTGELLHIDLQNQGNPELSEYDKRDQWDEWNDRRDADLRQYRGRTNLPEDVYAGTADLNRHGRWVTVDTYGTAWVPSYIDASWSPYSAGRWVYRPVFGWTWVSYEPWGWLPYHYGRWYRSSIYGWCWLPRPSFSFHFWSPALVSFYSGPGWVSWGPLGPGDYYDINHYHYNRRVHSHYVVQLRRLHHRAPGDHFHRDVRGAFRTVKIEHFRDGYFRGKDRVSRWESVDKPWSKGKYVKGRLDVKPSRWSYSAAPDRKPVRPRVHDSLPSVVRHVPRSASENRSRFVKISNPGVPSRPSRPVRAWSGKKESERQPARPTNNERWKNPVRDEKGTNNRSRVITPDERKSNSRWRGNPSGQDVKKTDTRPKLTEPQRRQENMSRSGVREKRETTVRQNQRQSQPKARVNESRAERQPSARSGGGQQKQSSSGKSNSRWSRGGGR